MAEAGKKQNAGEEGKARPGHAMRDGKGGSGKGGVGAKAAGAGRGRKTVTELVEAAALVAATKKASRKRASSKDGAEMLKQASDQALVEITGVVVEKLKNGAKERKVVCVKALMSFSEKKKPRAKRKRNSRVMKWIEEMSKERQWEGEPDAWVDDEKEGGLEGRPEFAVTR